VRRLVEAELMFELLDEFRVEPLGAAVFRGDGIDRAARVAAGADDVAAAAGDARGRRYVVAGELRDDALHRPARRELNHDKGNEQDPEQGRDHQQKPSQNIGAHRLHRADVCRSGQPFAGSLHQLSGKPRPKRGFSAGRANTSQ
jgi:hypothetical protein